MPRFRAVADRQHAVVEGFATRRVKNAPHVELEGPLVGFNGHRHRLARDGRSQRILIARRHVFMPINRHHVPRLPVDLALVFFSFVGIVGLGVDAAVGQDEVKGKVHQPPGAAVVVGGVAVDEFLFGEGHELARHNRVDSLHRARGRKRPARATLRLIFDGGDGGLGAPVDGVGERAGRQVAKRALRLGRQLGQAQPGGPVLVVRQVGQRVHAELMGGEGWWWW